MNVAFYFDPICPFSWIASRWLLMVSDERDVSIEWKPFSLALKNRQKHAERPSRSQAGHASSLRVLRVIEAAHIAHETSRIDFYTEIGMRYHLTGRAYDDALISEVLRQLSLPDDLLKAADDESYDALLEKSIKHATELAGQDIGVPTTAFVAVDGTTCGFYGPVLNTLPGKKEALQLWDGLSLLATTNSFYELKRSRPEGRPDVASTGAC